MKLVLLLPMLFVLPAAADVKIHDPIVSALAKPFGIERRIELHSIDELHFGPKGESRILLKLRNSGVKRVTLRNPVFTLECSAADGSRENLGELKIGEIEFPNTGGDKTVSRRYMVEFRNKLSGADVTKRLREAAKAGRAIRLIGRSDLAVEMGEKSDFNKKHVKLELTGTTRLGRGFSPKWHDSDRKLPGCGLR